MVHLGNFLFRWRRVRFKPNRPSRKCLGHRFFKKQQILRISNRYHGRERNCYGVAKRRVSRQLGQESNGRQILHRHLNLLYKARVSGALFDYNMSLYEFTAGLRKSNILLNFKAISLLAIYEPLSFKSLVKLSQRVVADAGLKSALWTPPEESYLNRI
ncbi:unnamed protein product [Gordionus sp. m RMFG-2023]|uniref:large ribosomal subunit protein bL20-like isoform X2 n=1 Tax=Gordionus sp. m RMFG-2023 TaxID=3053472 RepID=UPI0030E34ECF